MLGIMAQKYRRRPQHYHYGMHYNRQNRLVVNLVAFSWKLLARLARHVFWAGGWCRSTCGLAKIPSIHNVTFWSDRYMREHFEQTMRCQTHNGQEQECFWWIRSWQRLELQLSLNITIMTYHQSRWLKSGNFTLKWCCLKDFPIVCDSREEC